MTMPKDFTQIEWNEVLAEDCRRLIRLAVAEDLGRTYDWTTVSLAPEGSQGSADVVVRKAGVVCGLPVAALVLEEMNAQVQWQPLVSDGTQVAAGAVVAHLSGSARDLLTAERTLLNFIGRLSGIATLARQFVDAVAGTTARIYDTRKTTPGWRRLEKYAVRCGGGHNHRTGLYDAVLIKDNHLALGRQSGSGTRYTPAEAVEKSRQFVREVLSGDAQGKEMLIEVEVDSLEQLRQVLPALPDIVLLDNMTPAQLRQAVAIRSELSSAAELEASGGVNLQTIRAIAESGVERISIGALTHSAPNLDVGLDWSL
jgi:nicotinate-nucleotide pyrophosphorylase (carboxylating)